MSVVTVKEALITELRSITGIGLVEGREGRTSGFPWEDRTQKATFGWWVVKLKSSARANVDYAKTLGKTLYEHVWSIKGYYPWNFDASSEDRTDEYVDSIREQLKPDPALPDVCVHTLPPSLLDNDYVMLRTKSGEVLCHFLLIEFRTQEWVDNS